MDQSDSYPQTTKNFPIINILPRTKPDGLPLAIYEDQIDYIKVGKVPKHYVIDYKGRETSRTSPTAELKRS